MIKLTSDAAETNADLVSLYLREQQHTAVERFAQRHESSRTPLMEGAYRDLIPLSRPNPGEQYAFEVDLDACTGCKACVAACHNLNGLEPDEMWRNVGVLYGGSDSQPYLQHITTACHHCVEPACLSGCPVLAYDKDPVTGIVRHLDDQCIGCQYCIFMCPYDVPRYSSSKGIVRKCDMCHDRLAVGEAPACVQSCPNSAIRIRTVTTSSILEQCETGQFLASAPDPSLTLPSTTYLSQRATPRNVLPADYYSTEPRHSHLPLVLMLVLTQLSVGAVAIGQALVLGPWADGAMQSAIRPVYATAGVVLGLLGLSAAIFHLGRPFYAYRALLGLRTSWLSREILAFGLFGMLAAMQVGAVWLSLWQPQWGGIADFLGAVAAGTGIIAVVCSVMIYVRTGRPYWSLSRTSMVFFLTSVVLGLPIALLVSLLASLFRSDILASEIMRQYGLTICYGIMGATALKLLVEAHVFFELGQRRLTPLKRTAVLLTDHLSMATMMRFFFGLLGGVVLPLILVSERSVDRGVAGYHPGFLCAMITLVFALLSVGEFIERYLFFAASAAAKMPGAAQS